MGPGKTEVVLKHQGKTVCASEMLKMPVKTHALRHMSPDAPRTNLAYGDSAQFFLNVCGGECEGLVDIRGFSFGRSFFVDLVKMAIKDIFDLLRTSGCLYGVAGLVVGYGLYVLPHVRDRRWQSFCPPSALMPSSGPTLMCCRLVHPLL